MNKILKVALCLFQDVTSLDYQGPIEMLGCISLQNVPRRLKSPEASPHLFDITYFSNTLDPVKPESGPKLLPMRTYDDVQSDEQFDIIILPGGRGARPANVPPSLLEFVKRQGPGAKYLLTVCTGAWILALCGFLEGKRATTNKAAFRDVVAGTSSNITWVAKARWVVDGNVWTSSGVTAGMDMASAFLDHLLGEDIGRQIRNVVELSVRGQDDDEFAAVHGLV